MLKKINYLLILTMISYTFTLVSRYNVFGVEKLITYKTKYFSCTYPANWRKKERKIDSGIFVELYSPNRKDNFTPNINVNRIKLPKGATVEDYDKYAFPEGLKTIGGKLIKKDNFIVNGIKAIGYKVEWIQGKITIHVYQVIIIKNNIAYVLTCTALPKYYETNFTEFKKIIDSVKIIGN